MTRIELYINGVLFSGTPDYSDKSQITIERDGEEMYRRTSFSPSLTFKNDGYDAIYGSGLDTDFQVKFYNDDVLIGQGSFEKTDCEFDPEWRICKVKVSSMDAYEKIIKGRGDEYDIVRLAPNRESVTMNKRAVLQLYSFRDTKITNVIGNNSYEVDVNPAVSLDDLQYDDMEDYNFSVIGDQGAIRVVITEAPVENAEMLIGEYTGTWNGKDTILNRTDSSGYKIVMGEDRRGILKNVFWWEFRDADDALVTYQSLYFAKYYEYTPRTVRNIGHWAKVDDLREIIGVAPLNPEPITPGGVVPVLPTEHFVSTAEDTTIYARVLLDNGDVQIEDGDTIITPSALNEIDLSATNLNYRYTLPASIEVLGTGIDELVIRSTETQEEPTEWGVDGEGRYFVRPTSSNPQDNIIPVGWNRWIPKSFWFKSTPSIAEKLDSFNEEWVLADAYPLWSVIDVMLKKIDPSITFRGTSEYSQFLYGTYIEIPEYVSQLLYLTPITNIKRTYYSEAARKGTLTLQNIFDMLKAFQCYWYIDGQNRLRIEHIKWFKDGQNRGGSPLSADLTQMESPMAFKDWSYGTNTFTYDKDSLVNRYEFAWAEGSKVFNGYPINIENRYASKGKTLKTDIAKFVTDIDLIISAPDSIGDDYFALIGATGGAAPSICPIAELDNMGMDFVCPTFRLQNGCLSFFFLELAYWRYNMGGYFANIEGFLSSEGGAGIYDVKGIQRTRKQKVKFPLSPSDVGREGLVKTMVGTGEWVSCNYTPEDGMAEMELLFDTEDDALVSYEITDRYLDINTERRDNGVEIVVGNVTGIGGHMSLRCHANKSVKVNVDTYALGVGSRSVAYLGDVLRVSRTDVTNAERVTAYSSKNFALNAGDNFFCGYIQSSQPILGGEKIIITFSAR